MTPVVTRFMSAPDNCEKFVQVYSDYMPYVRSYLQLYTIDIQQAEDLTQDVFIKVFLHREQLFDVINIPGWLKTIAKNTYMDALRKTSLQLVPLESVFCDTEMSLQTETLEERLIYWELKRAVFQGPLTPMERSLLSEVVRGVPQTQIAHMLNIPEGTVRSKLHRVRKKLRRIVSVNSPVV